MSSPRPIVVTGGAGFIGSHTVEYLLRKGETVWVYDNLRTGSWANLAAVAGRPELHCREGDVNDCDQLRVFIDQLHPKAIIHLAALVSVQESIDKPALNFHLNIAGVQHVAEAALHAKVPRLVFASSAAVYGVTEDCPVRENSATAPISPYGAAKLASEELLLGYSRSFGLGVACLRYFNVFGPRQQANSPYSGVVSRFAKLCQSGQPMSIFGDGKQTRDFIHVRDLARANYLAAVSESMPSGRYNVCSSRETSLLDLVQIFSRIYPRCPDPTFEPARKGDIRRSVGDGAAFRRAVGFTAAEPLEPAIQELFSTQDAALH